MASNVVTESDLSFSEDEEREVNIYNDKGEIENLQPNGRKVKSKVPLTKRRGKRGMNKSYKTLK